MGRKPTKVAGAMVSLKRRKKQGKGILMEVINTEDLEKADPDGEYWTNYKYPWNPDEHGGRDHHLRTAIWQFQVEHTRHDDGPLMCDWRRPHRKYGYVHWFETPSEWEQKEIRQTRAWYPLDFMGVLSPGD